jgi:hypothetical protein
VPTGAKTHPLKGSLQLPTGATASWAENARGGPTRLIIPIALAVVTVLAAPPPDILAWRDQYEAALNAKDLDRLARFYQPDVTICDGGGVNTGWADYRDHHLGPELCEIEGLRLAPERSCPTAR